MIDGIQIRLSSILDVELKLSPDEILGRGQSIGQQTLLLTLDLGQPCQIISELLVQLSSYMLLDVTPFQPSSRDQEFVVDSSASEFGRSVLRQLGEDLVLLLELDLPGP